jgi:nucleoside-diphosphate-sugar epimerase
LKALVTGGGGFIGSHLCDRLLERGDEVVAVDTFITGNRRNVAHLEGHPRFRVLEQDAADPFDEPVDLVFHLASPASPIGYYQYPIETALANSAGTHRTLGVADRGGARYLLASTSEAYGDPLEHPQREDYWGHVNPVGPRSCYDESKRFAEALTMAYVRARGLDARIVRIFNTYGPRMDPEDGRMLPNFITRGLQGRPMEVFGDGSYTRSLCYVSDLVQGLLRAMDRGVPGRVYNLGNPDEHTVLWFAQRVQALCDPRPEIQFEPAREDDPTRRKPDIARAREELGWEPTVSLDEGLRQTVEWFREAIRIPTRGGR